MPKKISIIMPTLNEQFVIETSLIALQKFRSQAELILVDGGSKDNTLKLARPFVDRIIQTSAGRAIQMNAGAKIAQGEIYVFLHADTYLPENALTEIIHGINTGKTWGRFEIQLLGKSAWLQVISYCMNLRSRVTSIATGDQVIFVRRDVFVQIGAYPELELMEDIVLCKQLKSLSKPLCLRAKVQSSARRWEQFGLLKVILLMWSLRLRFWFGASTKTLANLYSSGKFF